MNNFQKLTIVILSYNRLVNLSKLIFKIYHFVKQNKITLIVLDDKSKFQINAQMKKFTLDYNRFTYIQNKKKIGHDKNYLKAIKLCKTEYLWIISDSLDVDTKDILNLNKYLDSKNDIIVLKSKNRDFTINKKEAKNKNILLEKLAWHCCLLGATVISKKIFSNINVKNIKRFKNFPHIGLIFSYISKNKYIIKIYDKKLLSSFKKESYWVNNAFKVFLEDWSFAILNLKNFNFKSKRIAIFNHDKNLRLYSFKNLIVLRSKKVLTLRDVLINFAKIKNYTQSNIFIMIVLSLVPSFIFQIFLNFYYKHIR